MPDRLSDAQLAEIEQRWAKLPLGPWKTVQIDMEGALCIPHPHWDIYRETADTEVVRDESGYLEARVDLSKPPHAVNVGCYLGEEAEAQAFADMRQAVPQLVAELRRTREALRWALAFVGEPTRRIKGQNEQYYDAYQKAREALGEESR